MPAQASGAPELDTRPPAYKPSFLLPSTAGWEPRRSDVKAEPGSFFFTPPLGTSPNGPRSGLISVAITLHPAAAEVRGPCPNTSGAGSGGCRSPGQQGVMPDPWHLSGKWMGTSHHSAIITTIGDVLKFWKQSRLCARGSLPVVLGTLGCARDETGVGRAGLGT